MSTRKTVVGQWGAEAMVCEDIYLGTDVNTKSKQKGAD